jgi:hypothetical protein
MKMRAPGVSTSPGKTRKTLIIIVLVAVAALIVWAAYNYVYKPKHNKINTGSDLTKSQMLDYQTKAAQKSIKDKDYASSVSYCYGAASVAYGQKNYEDSKSILQDCVKSVPDQYVPWYVYNALAVTAGSLNDKNLEKSSLQTAIKKAGEPNSGTDQATIDLMQKKLQGIN